MYWEALDSGAVRCVLCPRLCSIPEGARGFCGVRENRGGRLAAVGYGLVSSVALDPIEKKPLYMFCPGTRILSVGGFGCNLNCPFCQNYEISMFRDSGAAGGGNKNSQRDERRLTPEDILSLAKQTVPDRNIGVAYTYNEPFINYEFLFDCAKLVHEAGLKNVLVTNGYINKEPLEAILPYVDALNIDLKAFTDSFYGKIGGKTDTVMETIALSSKRCHVEVTTLVIPGENESDVAGIAGWLSSVSPDITLHLSRFFPRYKYSDREPTPRETITRLQETAKKYLKNVFAGNM